MQPPSGYRTPPVLIGLGVGAAVIAVGLALTYEAPPIQTSQTGFRGLAMADVQNPRRVADRVVANRVPEPQPAVQPAGQKAAELYENVPVLGDLDVEEFNRLMAAITEWVSPEQGCGYCHAEGEPLSSDKLYTKVVARKMLQMVGTINADWQAHVGATGVTCWTCHRGQPVPVGTWFTEPNPMQAGGGAQGPTGQNRPAPLATLASLPADPLTPLLSGPEAPIRVIDNRVLPLRGQQGASIQATELTYSLMHYVSDSLGVNCTYCHNSRSFFSWDQSTPQRTTAWHGIRMVRSLNQNYLLPLEGVFPKERLGPLGDVPKLACATCHQGAAKPLLGVSMLKDYPELAAIKR
ncbi:MAG: photosynthetic reaction center cytochrome c subunit [Geminicoccaceae bacterium]|nr:photosynthetic reaction center cytochrome c subunit [Geminicoccaceae bacterium]